MRRPNDFEPLEARSLLANTLNFTDEDGDLVTVKLTGNGEVQATLSGGATGFINLLQLIGTDGKSALTITVKQAGGGDGRVRLEDVSSATLGKFTAKTTDIFDDVSLSEVTSFTAGDVNDDSIDLDPPVGKTLSITARNLGEECDIRVDGDVKQIKVESADFDARVRVFGSVGSIRCSGNMSGDWIADSFGGVTVGEFFTGNILVRTPDVKGYTLGAFKAKAVKGGSIEVDTGGTPGRVKSIVTDLWGGGGIFARAIDTLKIKTDFSPGAAELTENRDDAFSIKTATIGGVANTQFELGAPVGTMKIFACGDGLDFDDNSGEVHVKSLTITGPDGARGSFAFTSIRTLKITAAMGGTWEMGGGDDLGRSIVSLKAGRIDTVNFAASGGIGSMSVGSVGNSLITTFFVGTMTVKPGAFGDGSFGGTMMLVTGAGGGLSIKSLSVKGACAGNDIRTFGSIGTFSAASVNGLALNVGDLSQSAFNEFADPTVEPSFISKFTLTAKFDTNAPAFRDSRIIAGTFEKIDIKGFTEPSTLLDVNGFAGVAFTSVTMKDLAGATIKPLVPNVNGLFNPFDPAASDFAFRVVVS